MSKETCGDCPNRRYNEHRKQRLERLEEGIARAELELSAGGLRAVSKSRRRELTKWVEDKMQQRDILREETPSMEAIAACEGPFIRHRDQNYEYTLQQRICGAGLEEFIEEQRVDPTRVLYNDAAAQNQLSVVEDR